MSGGSLDLLTRSFPWWSVLTLCITPTRSSPILMKQTFYELSANSFGSDGGHAVLRGAAAADSVVKVPSAQGSAG
eukprot:2041661-Rhodomonas_salina.1